jgi:hypothetical protein
MVRVLSSDFKELFMAERPFCSISLPDFPSQYAVKLRQAKIFTFMAFS